MGKGKVSELKGKPAPPHPVLPDLTDEEVRKQRSAAMLRLLSGQGRRSTFLTGPTGESAPAPITKTTLLGG